MRLIGPILLAFGCAGSGSVYPAYRLDLQIEGNATLGDEELEPIVEQELGELPRGPAVYHDLVRLHDARRALLDTYMNRGFVDARVESTDASLADRRATLRIGFSITEGPRYRLHHASVVEEDAAGLEIDPSALHDPELPESELEAGAWFDRSAVLARMEAIRELYGEAGHAHVSVDPVTSIDIDRREIGLTFRIRRGPRVTIQGVDVLDSSRPRDPRDIARVALAPGTPYRASRMRAAREALETAHPDRQVQTRLLKIDPDGAHVVARFLLVPRLAD